MNSNFKALISALVLLTTTTSFHPAVVAQTDIITRLRGGRRESVAETFNRAFSRNDPTFFRNRSIKRQIDLIFGPGTLRRNSYPENEIRRDAELIDILYRDVLNQQVNSDPVIRTLDLPNPYNTTIRTSPRINVNTQVEREIIFQTP